MRILAVSTYYLPYRSGLTLSLHRLARDLCLNGTLKVSVLTNKFTSHLASRSIIDGVSITRVPYLLRISKGFLPSPRALRTGQSLITDSDMLLVNLPSFEGFFYLCLAKIFRRKVVCLLGCLIYWDHGILSRLISFFSRILTYLQIVMADSVVSYSRDYVSHNSILSRLCTKKCSYLTPIVNTTPPDKAYKESLLKKKGRDVWIGYCGRVSREKGVHVLIESLRSLSVKNRCKLVLIGPRESVGEGIYASHIARLLKLEGAPPTHWLSDLSDERLSAALASCDILVLPSLNSTESFGMVQAEALARGVPVITTDLPGVRELVTKTRAGFVVPPNDVHALSSAINSSINNLAALRELAQSSQRGKQSQPINLRKRYEALFLSLYHSNNKAISK